jgi:hypothetical protein
MSEASAPILAFLRGMIEKRGLNTAALAQRCEIPRARLRRVLTGAEPMTIDELVAVSNALGLSAADMGLPEGADPAAADPPAPATSDRESAAPPADPWGNHPEQLFRVGFALGCDLLFLAEARQLEGSGVPAAVVAQYAQGAVPIRLDARWHEHNAPRYDPGGITLTLSFDALRDCRFPWSSIQQIVFFPAPVDPEVANERPIADQAPKARRPVLRLVQPGTDEPDSDGGDGDGDPR